MEIENQIDSLKIEGQKISVEDGDYDFVDKSLPRYKFELSIEPQFQQQFTALGKFVVRQVLIASHGHAQAYLESKTKNRNEIQKVGHLNFTKSKQQNLADLYIAGVQGDTLIIIFNFSIEEQYEFYFSTYIFGLLDSAFLSKVVILDTVYAEDLINITQSSASSLRRVSTSKYADKSLFSQISLLPTGNRLYGITADLLAHLEINNIQGEVLILSPNEREITFANIQLFEVIRTAFPSLNIDTKHTDAKHIIQKLNIQLFQSGMFM